MKEQGVAGDRPSREHIAALDQLAEVCDERDRLFKVLLNLVGVLDEYAERKSYGHSVGGMEERVREAHDAARIALRKSIGLGMMALTQALDATNRSRNDSNPQ